MIVLDFVTLRYCTLAFGAFRQQIGAFSQLRQRVFQYTGVLPQWG